MAFFALRESRPERTFSTGPYAKPPRKYEDISFIATGKPSGSGEGALGIYEAQLSISVCGLSEQGYVVYAFVDKYFQDGDEDSEQEVDDSVFMEDQIVADGVDANKPVWEPREYFVLAVLPRQKQVVEEWANLLDRLEEYIGEYNKNNPAQNRPSRPDSEANDPMTIYEWIYSTLSILRDIRQPLKQTIKAGTRFFADGGDIDFFSDLKRLSDQARERMSLSLREMKANFETLADIEGRLAHLIDQLEASSEFLQLRITLESNEAARMNSFAQWLMISLVSPAAVVSTFFSIPAPFGTFPRNGRTFALAIAIVTGVLQVLIILNDRKRSILLYCTRFASTKGKLQGCRRKVGRWRKESAHPEDDGSSIGAA